MTNAHDLTVIHNDAAKRFEVHVEKQTAIMEYMRAGNYIIFTHTEVPENLEGRGIAGKMAHTALEYAKEAGLRVQALCPFVASYVANHPEYQAITLGY
jgi:uncharacterized protein